MGSSIAVLDFVNIGETLSVRQKAKFGQDIFAHGKLYFAEDTYLAQDSDALKAVVKGESSLSLTSTGGTLHGTWFADTVISVSDRRLKDNIRPLKKTLGTNWEALGSPAEQQLRANTKTAAKAGEIPKEEEGSPFSWVLRQLRPVSYNFKVGADAKNMRFGFIADEVEKVLPQVVRELPNHKQEPGEEKKKGIIYPDLIAVLTGMMREFGDQLKAVQARVKLSEMELDRLDREDPMDDLDP